MAQNQNPNSNGANVTTQERGPNITTVFRNRILRTSLPSSSKMIAIVINEATDHGTGEHCWLSIETIAERASLSKNTVKTHLKNLIRGGYIIREKIQHLDRPPEGCYKSEGYLYKISLRWGSTAEGSTIAPVNDSPPPGSTIDPPQGQPLTPTSSLTSSSYQEEEEVAGNAISDSKNEASPEPPSTSEDSSLDEEQPPTPDEDLAGDGERELFDAWALDRLQKLGAKIGDRNGATIQRAMKLCQAIASFGEGVDYRTRCEWLKSRVDNYTMRQLEDEGPNPPSSVHQAVGWLESDLQGGSLERYYKKVRVERADEERLRNLPPAHECDNHQDIVLPPMFDLEEVAK